MEKKNSKIGALLVVEDNKADQGIIREVFLTLGISNKIIIAENVAEALKYLRSDEIVPHFNSL